ncbi:methyltransferase domain-containing protein [Paenibacillus sp. PL2-23]|uniref:methyltransferase domain-containing protein n=1 Tax=Paenibacillus sp. PL2-23 TaxID=2100729 RepID=UPI0030FCD2BD
MTLKHYEQAGVAMTCRGFGEYEAMFGLTAAELAAGAILDVAAGGSSFVAEARARGFEAYAVDPRYGEAASRWAQEAKAEIETSTEKLAALKESFDWSYYGSIEQHRKGRLASLAQFAAHAETSDVYRYGALPELPFRDDTFELILCSHFLFLYAEAFGESFHEASVRELMRVCKPGGVIKIYPLLSLKWEPYAGLQELMDLVRAEGGQPYLRASGLPFIPGSTHRLDIVAGS